MLHKPGDLSSILQTHIKAEGEINFTKLSFYLCMHIMTTACMHACIHTSYIHTCIFQHLDRNCILDLSLLYCYGHEQSAELFVEHFPREMLSHSTLIVLIYFPKISLENFSLIVNHRWTSLSDPQPELKLSPRKSILS